MLSISSTLTVCAAELDKTSDMLQPGNRFMSIGGSYTNTQTQNLLHSSPTTFRNITKVNVFCEAHG